MCRSHRERSEDLPGREPLQVGDGDLDDEASARFEVTRDVAEAVNLLVLRDEVRDRVEDEVRERERPGNPRGGEVADLVVSCWYTREGVVRNLAYLSDA